MNNIIVISYTFIFSINMCINFNNFFTVDLISIIVVLLIFGLPTIHIYVTNPVRRFLVF